MLRLQVEYPFDLTSVFSVRRLGGKKRLIFLDFWADLYTSFFTAFNVSEMHVVKPFFSFKAK